MIINTANIKLKPALPWIFRVVIVALLLWIILRPVKRVVSDGPATAALQQQTDSLLKSDRIKTADSVRQKVIDSLKTNSKTADQKIIIITQNEQKAIDDIKRRHAADIERALTDRYNKAR